MSKVIFLFIIVATISVACGEVHELEEHKLSFINFIVKHGKRYNTQEEFEHRFGIFKENLEKINKWNAESNDTQFGINGFADLTFEEFRSRYTGLLLDDKLETDAVKYTPLGNAPGELDYRKQGLVTKVKTQGCSDCYIFSTIGNYYIPSFTPTPPNR